MSSQLRIGSLAVLRRAAFPLACLAALVGCSDGLPKRAPVSGVVMIDGKPLSHGLVRFVPEEGRAAVGGVDEQGRFELTCYELGDGATLGVHKVAVEATEPLPGDRKKWHAPKKYANEDKSGITQSIDGPVSDLQIDLSWDGGQPFVEN